MSDLTKVRIPTEKAIFDDMLADAKKKGLNVEAGTANRTIAECAASTLRQLYVDLMKLCSTEPNPDDISADGRTQGVRAK